LPIALKKAANAAIKQKKKLLSDQDKCPECLRRFLNLQLPSIIHGGGHLPKYYNGRGALRSAV